MDLVAVLTSRIAVDVIEFVASNVWLVGIAAKCAMMCRWELSSGLICNGRVL